MPTELDDRITRALGRLADSVDVAEPIEVPNIEWSAPPEAVRRGAIVGWLAVAAAVVIVLVMVGVWRRDGDTGVSDTPVTPTTTVPVPYGEIPPLDDASIFYLPDPMPDGWHVTRVIHGVDLEYDGPSAGEPLDADPPMPAGTTRGLTVAMIREDGAAAVNFSVVEKPVVHTFSVSDGGQEIAVGDQRIASYLGGPGYGPWWLENSAFWAWVQDGRSIEMYIAGDPAAAEPIVSAMRPVSGQRLLDAVAEGQQFGRSLPALAEVTLANGARATGRGVDERVVAMCVDAYVSTCTFVGTEYSRGGVALGWAGTEHGGFQVAWFAANHAERLADDVSTYRTEFGTFVTDIGPDGLALSSSEGFRESIGIARWDLVGMPRLAELTADGASVVPITVPAEPGATAPATTEPTVPGGTVDADGGVIEVPPDASIFHLPAELPDGWLVGSVSHVVDAELDWSDDGEEIEAVPPFESATAREFTVHLIRTDGTAFASLDVWETPHADSFAPFDDAEVVRVAGIDRAVSPRSTGLPAPLGLTGGREWRWVQNGRSFTLSIVGDETDAATILTAILPASATEIVEAVQAGQNVARALPVIEQVTTDDGATVTTHGEDGRVVAACIDDVAVRRCGFVDELGGYPDVIYRSYLTESGPSAFVWVPTSLRDSVFSPERLIDTPTGAFAASTEPLIFGDVSRQEIQPLPHLRLGEPVGTTFDEPFVPLGEVGAGDERAGDPAVWTLSTDPAPNETSFEADVSRLGCANGVTGEVFLPDVQLLDDRIIVTFEVEAFGPGEATCPGNDLVPYTIELGEPIGDRMLVDGACLAGGPAATTSWCVDDDGVRRP